MVSKREYEKIYNAARIEQLEQDISMIKDIADRSEDYTDFKNKLSDELRRLDLNVVEG